MSAPYTRLKRSETIFVVFIGVLAFLASVSAGFMDTSGTWLLPR